jgi:hypothetical protein
MARPAFSLRVKLYSSKFGSGPYSAQNIHVTAVLTYFIASSKAVTYMHVHW